MVELVHREVAGKNMPPLDGYAIVSMAGGLIEPAIWHKFSGANNWPSSSGRETPRLEVRQPSETFGLDKHGLDSRGADGATTSFAR